MRIIFTSLLLVIFGSATELLAQSSDELVTQAILKFEAGDFAECLTDIDQALVAPGELSAQRLAQAHLYRGRLYLRQQMDSVAAGNTEAFANAQLKAHEEYKKALSADDGSVTSVINVQINQLFPLLFNTGIEAYNASINAEGGQKTEQLNRAAQYIGAANEIRSDDYRLSDVLGRIHYGLEHWEDALSYFLNARRQYRGVRSRVPDFNAITNIHLSAANILHHHLNPSSRSRAMESAQAGLATLNAEYSRFITDFSSGDTETEERYVSGKKKLTTKILELFTEMPERINQALPVFEEAVNTDFIDDEEVHIAYANLVKSQNLQRSVQLLERAIQINPSNGIAHLDYGISLYNLSMRMYEENNNSFNDMSAEDVATFKQHMETAKTHIDTFKSLEPSSTDNETADGVLASVQEFLDFLSQ